MNDEKKYARALHLGLFDGAAGSAGDGDGSASGGDGASASPGRGSRTAAATGGKRAASGETTGASAGTGADNTGEGSEPAASAPQDEARARRAEFERLIASEYKDLYAEKTQKLIDRRFRQTKELEEQAGKMRPILEKLSERYGESDPGRLLEAMQREALAGGDSPVPAGGNPQEGEAGDFEGMSPPVKELLARLSERYGESDPERLLGAVDRELEPVRREAKARGMTLPQLFQFQKIVQQQAAARSAAQEKRRRAGAHKTYGEWLNQAQAVGRQYPGFDLQGECRNPQFLHLLRSGVDVKTAYEVLHRDDILGGAMAYTAQKVREKVVEDIRARGMRPSENGAVSSPAAVTRTDVNALTKAQREEIEKRVLRGEKIRF